MQLKQLKLAGFKSFVDPTVVHFPSQLVAVVGPNGCGKSNIIDAVRWVMGESSAKNLRGESMIDVIFNGSSQRKPLGQASVELVFDNSLGRLTGSLASYAEISVKRLVTRDGDSSYYLNGTRCRRKDITELFLGTGAGAKGYSIIGQGTVSRIIEARPEELRVFLEEAAGVSKYKERRRETLQRIEHTQENLTRIADIRDELGKQLLRLERQAKAAERYTGLKEEEQIKRAEISAFKWHDLKQHQLAKQAQLHQLADDFEQQQTLLTDFNEQRLVLNEQMQQVTLELEDTQILFYQLGTEKALLEETIQQQSREKERLEQDRQQRQEDWAQANGLLIQAKDALEQAQLDAKRLEQQRDDAQTQLKTQDIQWQEAQTQKLQWEESSQDILHKINHTKSELQVTKLNLQHMNQRRQQALLRLEQLQSEKLSLSLDDLQQKKCLLEGNQEQLKTSQIQEEEALKQAGELVNLQRVLVKKIEQELHQVQDDFYHMNSELAALKAWQKAARQVNKNKPERITEWSEKPRLMDLLEVEPKWQTACEMILGDSLQAYVLQSIDEFWPQYKACETQGEAIITFKTQAKQQSAYPRLVDYIKGSIPATAQNLERIYVAEDLDEARSCLMHMTDDESVVTVGGLWLGKGWVRCAQVLEQDELGLLAGQQKIVELGAGVQILQQKIATLTTDRDQGHSQLQQHVNQVEICQGRLNASNDALRTHLNAFNSVEQSIIHAMQRAEHIAFDVEEQQSLLEDTAGILLESGELLAQLEAEDALQALQQVQLLNEKNIWSESFAIKSKALEATRHLTHQFELEHNRELTKIHQLSDRIIADEDRLEKLEERLEHLAMLCLDAANPDAQLRVQLTELVFKQETVNTQLALIREQLSQLKNELDHLEKTRSKTDLDVKHMQEAIAQTRMQEQELAIRASSVQELLGESGFDAQSVFQQIPTGITQSQREDELISLSEQIKRLGAINLAAIEEFAIEQQRKQYLDDQSEDLSQALAALQTAIEQMDKETLLRLQSTFDEVNSFFKALFPRLFGGGRAQLELTCDNLLEAGIVVMAQPPGKRNSTIHLLSGGEKAMTAVALVFAIFQLNPSPFCMLDEVDAPLDDVNVGRFCDLVKEMSQFVQFLFITHNKVTMELADHLIGVTMREPGVSRLVTVDVKQALILE